MNVLQTNTRQAFAQNLSDLLDRHGLPASNHGRVKAFAALVNRPVSTVHRWIAGKGMPDLEDLFLLCGIFACSMDEILGRFPIKQESFDKNQTTKATYYSDNGNVEIEIPSSFMPFTEVAHPLGIYRLAGKEMSGYAEPNDRVFFDLSDTQVRSGSVYVLRFAGKLAVRRLRIRIDQLIDVLCENPRYPSEQVDPQHLKVADEATDTDVAILGRVIAKLNFDQP